MRDADGITRGYKRRIARLKLGQIDSDQDRFALRRTTAKKDRPSCTHIGCNRVQAWDKLYDIPLFPNKGCYTHAIWPGAMAGIIQCNDCRHWQDRCTWRWRHDLIFIPGTTNYYDAYTEHKCLFYNPIPSG